MMQRLTLILIISVFMLSSACKKLPSYSDVPTLEYKSLAFEKDESGNDEKFVLTATFTDGDGDVGYHSDPVNGAIFDSTSSPYYYNFVITLSYMVNNEWRDTAFNVSTRLPYLTPDGKYKALKATIDKTDYLPYFSTATTNI